MSVKLIIIEGIDRGREVRISKQPFTIGRNTDNDLILMDDRTSRFHAEITEAEDGKYHIKDKTSKNGIFVNGRQVTESPLSSGDVIEIGQNKLLLKKDDAVFGKVEIIQKEGGSDSDIDKIIAGKDEFSADIHPELVADEPTNITPKLNSSLTDPLKESLTLRLKALQQVAKALSNIETETTLLNAVVNILQQSMPAHNAGVFLFDPEEKKYRPCIFRAAREEPVFSEEGVQEAIEKFKRKSFSFIGTSDDTKILKDSKESLSIMLSAIKTQEAIHGFIYLDCQKNNHVYSTNDLETLDALSDMLATGIEKSILLKDTKFMSERIGKLEKHLSPEIANAISDHKKPILESPIDAHEKEVTILFSDIIDFTSLSERLSPPELASLLNEYFSRMVEIIIANKGTVNKFIGDAVMAIFGAPIEHGDDPQNAVIAAIQMIGALKSFHTQIDEKKRFNIRIGVNTGNTIIGVIGSEKRMEYTALGDTVNCASRIERLAQANGVAIGELTHEKIKDQFECEPVGEVNVKGKANPIKVYLVKGLKR